MFGRSSNGSVPRIVLAYVDLPDYFLPALTFAHLALWAAAIFLRPAADIVRLGLAATFLSVRVPLCPSRFLREADLPASSGGHSKPLPGWTPTR